MPPAPSGCPRSCSRPVQLRSQRHQIAALTGSTTRAPSARFPVPHTRHAARALTGSWIGPRGLLGAPALWDLTVVRCCWGSMDLSVGLLRIASRKGNCVSGALGSWRCGEPSAGSEGAARVIRFAPAAGCELAGGSEPPSKSRASGMLSASGTAL